MKDNIEDIDSDEEPLTLARLHAERSRGIIEDEAPRSLKGLATMLLLELVEMLLLSMIRNEQDDRE